MAITHGTATRTAACDLIVDRLDLGTPGPPKLVFLDASNVAVATLNMNNTNAFGAASNGTASAASITNDPAAAGGVTTKFELRDRSGTMVIAGSVGTSGADINLSSTNIGSGDIVSVSSMTYTAMP